MKARNRLKRLILGMLVFGLSFHISLGAQESGGEPEALPRSFRRISLGMGIEDLKNALQQDELFQFRGDRDVSFLPAREQNLIETAGYSFLRRAYFQLYEDSLFIMAYSLNTSLVDHYSVYTSLVSRYGEPQIINPREVVWESDTVRLSIERPLTVKYIDMRVFNSLLEESEQSQSREIARREEFLNEF